MIAVYADRRGEKYRLLVEGHAGGEERGRLVCAAVSALTGALVAYAKNNPVCHHVRAFTDKGKVFLSCRLGLENAFEMTVGARAELAAVYPQHMVFHGESVSEGAFADSPIYENAR